MDPLPHPFRRLGFLLVNLTDAMGVINLSGPNARKVLAKVVDIDLSNAAFPFSGYREFMIKDTVFVRAMRLGFVGELSYELHVPSSYMQAVWDMLKEAGAEFGIRNFGVEAQNVLRMEKCHIILGLRIRTAHQPAGSGPGLSLGPQESRCQDRRCRGPAPGGKGSRPAQAGGHPHGRRHPPARDGALIVDSKVRGYVATMRKSFTTGQKPWAWPWWNPSWPTSAPGWRFSKMNAMGCGCMPGGCHAVL
jgi:sarcosine oxidase subunit alpha